MITGDTLRAEAREHRQQARRLAEAAAILDGPVRRIGRLRHCNNPTELQRAFEGSGLTYDGVSRELGFSQKWISMIVRGLVSRPEIEERIRAIISEVNSGVSAHDAAGESAR
jgi:hypothetical protein